MNQAAAWPSAGSFAPGQRTSAGTSPSPGIRSIGDVRFCTGLVRSVAWSFWSVAWSVRSGLVRTAGDRITGRGLAGVGGQVGDGLLDAGQLVAEAGQEPSGSRRLRCAGRGCTGRSARCSGLPLRSSRARRRWRSGRASPAAAGPPGRCRRPRASPRSSRPVISAEQHLGVRAGQPGPQRLRHASAAAGRRTGRPPAARSAGRTVGGQPPPADLGGGGLPFPVALDHHRRPGSGPAALGGWPGRVRASGRAVGCGGAGAGRGTGRCARSWPGSAQ